MMSMTQTIRVPRFGQNRFSSSAILTTVLFSLALLLGIPSVASATPVTYAFSGTLGTGLPANADYDGAILSGTITFDDEDQINTGFDLGYRGTDWSISVTGGNDPVEFISSAEAADALTIVLDRGTDSISIGIVEDLTGNAGVRFFTRHSIFLRFDAGLDIVTATEWSDIAASQYAPNSGFENGTLQFTGGQIPHAFTDSGLVLVPEPGTATLLMLGLVLASSRRRTVNR